MNRTTRRLIYFVHQFKPSFDGHALLDDPEMLAAATAINRQIRELAPVLDSQAVADGVTVTSSASGAPIDAIAKHREGAVYVFAAAMRHTRATASFELSDAPGKSEARLLGEDRVISVKDGRFADSFDPDGEPSDVPKSVRIGRRSAGWKPATQQIGNLRYAEVSSLPQPPQ